MSEQVKNNIKDTNNAKDNNNKENNTKENNIKENNTKESDTKENNLIINNSIDNNIDKKKKVIIDVRNLYKIYKVGNNKIKALNGVDFKVYEGEFCAIVGTSGSGKSTLLNMMAGLEKPTKGQIIINRHHIEKFNENQLVKFRGAHVGFIFQSFNLLGTLNVVENIALPLMFRGMKKKERMKRANDISELVGLTKHKKHRPNQLSGGQQQRVGMARALVVNPDIVFADEPTGNLDSATSKEMMELMREVVNKHNKTLVMVTHDDNLASYADRVIRIVDGKVVRHQIRINDVLCDINQEENNEKA